MAHDHSHGHEHSHGDGNSYYLNQLFTIAVCGALGGVAVTLWFRALTTEGMLSLFRHPSGSELAQHQEWLRPNNMLSLMLGEKFFLWVLLGGIALLTLVTIRAIALWRSVDHPLTAHPHSHDHDHDHCGHEHGHCHHEHATPSESATPVHSGGEAPSLSAMEYQLDHEHDHAHDHAHGHSHDHDHGHDHGFAPWRYVVLLLPVVLYFLNLPNQIFSADVGGDPLKGLTLDAPTKVVRSTGTVEVGFGELQHASLSQETRDYYEGKNVTLIGMYYGNDPKRFTLRRFKINCCAGDAVPLNAIIMVDANSSAKVDPDVYRNQWVQVMGRVSFLQKPGTNEFLTALILYPADQEDIKKLVSKIPVPPKPWIN